MGQSKKHTVLLIDDEPDILELMEEEFRLADFCTLTASCGNDAIDIIVCQNIDVVISDYKMPNGNGMDVLRAVNGMEDETRPLFYFISGQADISPQDAVNAGALKFYSKPFSLDLLIQEVKKDLRRFAKKSPDTISL